MLFAFRPILKNYAAFNSVHCLRRRAMLTRGALALPVTMAMRHSVAATQLPQGRQLGVYRGAGCDGRSRIPTFGHWLGREPGWVVDFLPYATWADLQESPNWFSRCWNGTTHRLSLAVPMLIKNDNATLADGAAGAFDIVFERLATLLVAEGLAETVIRLGWEFNGNWIPWSAAKNPLAFIEYWRRVVIRMRSVNGSAFQFEWAPSLGRNAIDAAEVYPGRDFVDLIGMSVYNESWSVQRADAQSRWQSLVNAPNGLRWQLEFAAAEGKRRSFPEWGTGERPDGKGGGDDAYFIERMASWVKASDVEYYSYFDYSAPDYDARISDGRYPAAARAFKLHFGAGATGLD